MKKTDKVLAGIVGGIILLVVVAFVVALTKPAPSYQAEDSPEGVAFNYLFALQEKNYERAYGYLAPAIRGYPRNVEIFRDDIQDYSWFFGDLGDSSTTLVIDAVSIDGSFADVDILQTHFYEGDLFESGQYSTTFTMTLRQAENGEWKIIDGTEYWLDCWDEYGGCD